MNPYNIKIIVYCQNENEAQAVQNAFTGITNDLTLKAPELLNFYTKFKQNETIIKPILQDIIRNGLMSIAKHIPKLLKIR